PVWIACWLASSPSYRRIAVVAHVDCRAVGSGKQRAGRPAGIWSGPTCGLAVLKMVPIVPPVKSDLLTMLRLRTSDRGGARLRAVDLVLEPVAAADRVASFLLAALLRTRTSSKAPLSLSRRISASSVTSFSAYFSAENLPLSEALTPTSS